MPPRRTTALPRRWDIPALALAGGLGAAWLLDAIRRDRRSRGLHRALVDLLLNALTADDSATARHSRRVADLTDVLATELRLRRKDRSTLRLAALLHDLGKVDDRFFPILHSTTPLTVQQRQQLEHHPRMSADILGPLDRFHPGLTAIVSSHHECWDGEGYPDGLAGDLIPLGARLISAADVFDAMGQPRTYHRGVPADEVLRTIRDGAGRQFDPEVVALLDRPCVEEQWLEIFWMGRQEEEAAAGEAAAITG